MFSSHQHMLSFPKPLSRMPRPPPLMFKCVHYLRGCNHLRNYSIASRDWIDIPEGDRIIGVGIRIRIRCLNDEVVNLIVAVAPSTPYPPL